MNQFPSRATQYALVAAGGAAGTWIRWTVAESWAIDVFPWPTLIVNVVGCALIALFSGDGLSIRTHRFAALGFCGGLTTFSTLSVEIVRLADGGHASMAIAYGLISVALGLAALLATRFALTLLANEFGRRLEK